MVRTKVIWGLTGWMLISTPLPKTIVRFNGQTIAIADPNRKTLTIFDQIGELWICAQLEADARTCKSSADVRSWILRDGDPQ